MIIANIFPIANQSFYKTESMVMLLAHLFDKYDPKYFNRDQFIILDNGLYEGAQVSTNLQTIVDMADNSKIKINEIVIPDKFFDREATEQLFMDNYDIIVKNQHKYSFMYVAQSKNIEEFAETMKWIEQFKDLNLTIGIPKKAPFNRECDEAIEIYKKCSFPIHFLGLTDTTPLIDLDKVKDIIRSCDTSQMVTYLKNAGENYLTYVRKPEDKPIDLENDVIDNYELSMMKYIESRRNYLKNNGVEE